jgi:hypothetical protein
MNRAAPVTVVAAMLAVCASAGAQEAPPPDEKLQCVKAAEAGQNQRDDGHYRAARESFLACSQSSCPPVIVQSCTQWLHDMQEVMPSLVLGAKDDRGNDLLDAKVTIDGQPLTGALDGKPIEADSGEHVLRFERDGSIPSEQKVVLRAGERARVVTVVLHAIGGLAPPEPRPPPPSGGRVTAHIATAASLAAAALAGGAIGAVFLVESNQAGSQAASLRSGLPSSSACAGGSPLMNCASLNDKVNAEYRDLNLSTGLFVAAGVLAAGALVTWFAWPRDAAQAPSATAWIAPATGGATVGIAGSFE